MTDTTCPSCDAPAPAGASRCARCGYGFVEAGGAERQLPRPGRRAAAATVLAALAAAVLLLVNGGNGGGDDTAHGSASSSRLPVLSEHPLGRRAAERLLEERYLPVPDDDEADVTCSGRVPRPAHSVRRCRVRYPGGSNRTIVVLTNANGSEVLSEP